MSVDLLVIGKWVRECASSGARRPNTTRHGSIESLRMLSLLNRHGQSSSMQHLFITKQFPLWTIHSLASRSITSDDNIFLLHTDKFVTHLRKLLESSTRSRNLRNFPRKRHWYYIFKIGFFFCPLESQIIQRKDLLEEREEEEEWVKTKTVIDYGKRRFKF